MYIQARTSKVGATAVPQNARELSPVVGPSSQADENDSKAQLSPVVGPSSQADENDSKAQLSPVIGPSSQADENDSKPLVSEPVQTEAKPQSECKRAAGQKTKFIGKYSNGAAFVAAMRMYAPPGGRHSLNGVKVYKRKNNKLGYLIAHCQRSGHQTSKTTLNSKSQKVCTCVSVFVSFIFNINYKYHISHPVH